MSELIENNKTRIEALADFATRLINGENGILLIDKHKQVLETVSPFETMEVIDRLLVQGMSVETLKSGVGKIINVFYKSLQSFSWEKPTDGHFLHYLMLENLEVKKIIEENRPIIKTVLKGGKDEQDSNLGQLRTFVNRLKEYELHYIKKENILFPYLEKTFSQYRCLQLMWSFHDDFRKSLKTLSAELQTTSPDIAKLNLEIGKIFFVILPIIFREEQIVFPVAIRAIPGKIFASMLTESKDIGWCYLIQPDYAIEEPEKPTFMDDKIRLGTGLLSPQQIIMMLNHLPVDITFVDENDEVAYYSAGKHRIFPRSNFIIGRKVQDCHPPESVHIVNEIVDAFKKGTKDQADFWIQMHGKFIYIRYFAVRESDGTYKGTVEVSQDITDIKKLEGEQRLLDWNK